MKPSEAAHRQKLFAASKTRYPSDLSSTRSCSSAWRNLKKPPAGLIPAPRQTCEGGGFARKEATWHLRVALTESRSPKQAARICRATESWTRKAERDCFRGVGQSSASKVPSATGWQRRGRTARLT